MTAIQPSAASTALLVKLAARPDFSAISQLPRGAERKSAAYDALVATAASSQAPFIALADKLQADGAIAGYELLASPNMLVVTPSSSAKSREVAAAFQAMEGVKAIYSNQNGMRLKGTELPTLAPGEPTWGLDVLDVPVVQVAPPTERPYGVDLIGAPEAWAQGADGHGLVYGSIDTGADVSHEAIADDYRGRAADGSLDHDYSWFDPTGKLTAPADSHGHGTHTIGTVTGIEVGSAPKAKFISAAGLSGEVDGTLKSLQWMLAPTKIDGSAPDPTKAPDVVGMSWWTGSSSEDLFLESMQDLRAAGIVPVKSAGNKGPGSGSISSPGQYTEIIATAAVDANGDIARFSSRGPAPYPAGSTTPKPDYAAPGVNVISSTPGNKYAKMSGTSMAQPHMSAAVLDILSAYPTLTDAQLDQVLAEGAIDKGAPGVDSEYGAGLINLPASLAAAERLTLGAPRGR
jgi:hypothetical protein